MSLRPASPFVRIAAHFVDLLLIFALALAGAVFGGVLAVNGYGQALPKNFSNEELKALAARGVMLGYCFWMFAAFVINFGVIEGKWGGSAGKLLFGIRVQKADGQPIGVMTSLSRSFCYIISGVPFYAGYLMLFFSEYSQCWHDRICETFVVSKDGFVKLPVLQPQQDDLPAKVA